MENTLTIDQVKQLSFQNERPLEGVLAFLASRSRKSTRDLSAAANEIFRGFGEYLDELLKGLIEKRTAAEFEAAFNEAFPKYAAMTLSLSHFAHVVLPSNVVERLTRESICELEADFREQALLAFGAAVRDQAMFTVWTLRKINDLVTQISGTKIDKDRQKEDTEYCERFNAYALRAHFSLDCLTMALRLRQPIYPEVMVEVVDGLRGMVNAYAWARRGAALRISSGEGAPVPPPLDEEDEYLLSASMHDMAAIDEDESPVDGD